MPREFHIKHLAPYGTLCEELTAPTLVSRIQLAVEKGLVYSSFGAEILSCCESDNRLFGLRSGFEELVHFSFNSELVVDSHGLYSCITTLSEQRKYRLRRTVARIRESFDSGDLTVLRWIRGVLNLADAQTKFNMSTWSLLSKTLHDGELAVVSATSRGEDSWKDHPPAALSRGQ